MPIFSKTPVGSAIKIAPSLIAANFSHLGRDLARVESSADLLHVDIMDGHFVPNISLGPFIVKQVHGMTKLPLDLHLMISEPKRYAAQFAEAGATNITFHLEADSEGIDAIIEEIRSLQCTVGISIKPDTAFSSVIPWLKRVDRLLIMTVEPGFGGQKFIPEMLDKVKEAREYRDTHREEAHYDIEVDGGLSVETIGSCVTVGAEVIVAGTAVFGKADAAQAIRDMKEAAEQSLSQR